MKKLRIGLLIDSYEVPSWVYNMTEQIINSGYAEIGSVIVNKGYIKKRSFLQKVLHSPSTIFYSTYRRIDKLFFSSRQDAYRKVNLQNILGNTSVLSIAPNSTSFSDRFEESDIDLIKQENLDIILRLGFKILRGNILHAARFGIWSFHHGDNKFNRGGPSGVWEVLQNWNKTGVVLQVLTEELDGGLVIEKIYSKTDHISSHRNNNNSYWKSISLILRNLKKMHSLGGEEFMRQVKSQNANPYFLLQSTVCNTHQF